MDAALSSIGLESAIEHFQVFGFETALHDDAIFFDIFDRVVFLDVRDNRFDLLAGIAQAAKRFGHGAVDDFQHAPSGQQFVFHQRNVGFNAGRVAVHQKSNRAGGR